MTKSNTDMKNHNFDILKKNIDALMKKKGWSQTELGEKIGMDQSNVSKCLNEGRHFTLEQVCRLADIFEMSVDELLGRENKAKDYSAVEICKFIVDLITSDVITTFKYEKNENVWEEYDYEYDSGYSNKTKVLKYDAFYFSTYEQMPDYLDEHTAENKFDEFKFCGNFIKKNAKINHFLYKFIDTRSKYLKGILTKEEYNTITELYIKNIEND